MRKHLAVAFPMVLALAWAGLVPAHAAGPATPLFSINAGYLNQTTLNQDHFNYAIPPGTSVSDSLVVTNYSDSALRVHVYGADMLSALGGGFAPAQVYQKMTAVGAWLRVTSPVLTIAPREAIADSFQLDLPQTVTPGDYVGAVVAAVDLPGKLRGTEQETRAALIVKVSVPGAVRAGTRLGGLTSADTAVGKQFSVTFRNPGNVLLTLNGAIDIRDGSGHFVTRIPLEPQGIYVIPGGTTTLRATWTATPLGGLYSAQAELKASFAQHGFKALSTPPVRLVFVPLGHIGAALALLLALGLAWRPASRWLVDYRGERRDVREFKRQRRAARPRA